MTGTARPTTAPSGRWAPTAGWALPAGRVRRERGSAGSRQQIFANEAARADVHLPSVTLQTVGPTLQAFGTHKQKDPVPQADPRRATCHFAIGTPSPTPAPTSRPCAPRARRDGRRVRRQRAEDVDHGRARGGLRLARRAHRPRGPQAPGHLGADRGHEGSPATPGPRSSPRTRSHHTNATYYNDVRVPADMLVGEENRGVAADHDAAQPRAGDARPGRSARGTPGHGRRRGPATGEDAHRLTSAVGPAVRDTLANDGGVPRQRAAQLAGRWGQPEVQAVVRRSRTRRPRRSSPPTRCSRSGWALERIVHDVRRPGRTPETADAGALPRRDPSKRNPRAHLRRWRQRGAARADRHVRARPAEGAAMTETSTELAHDWIIAETERLKALGETEPRLARDPVNQPMINNWLEALGEDRSAVRPRGGAAGDGPGLDHVRAGPDPSRGRPAPRCHADARRGGVRSRCSAPTATRPTSAT